MCEYCREMTVTVNPLAHDEEADCERTGWYEKPATYWVFEWYVEDHLCDVHMAQEKSDLSAGVEDFLHEVGFQECFDFRPITKEETCDYFSPPHLSVSTERCSKKATYAKSVLEKYTLFSKHAAEMGRTSSESGSL